MRSQEKRASTLVIALAAVVVACLAVGAWLVAENRDREDELSEVRGQTQALQAEKDAEVDALRAAGAFLVEATGYSHEEGEHDFAWVDELNNGEVKAGLQPVVADLQKVIRQEKVTAKGEVIESAARVVADDHVEVVAFVDQAIVRADSPEVSIEEMRISMTMKLVGGTWRVDRLDFLNGGLGEATP